ncbi:L,D-transpeptidase family protein [Photobacterium rosenbergii]|uniref:L,D-transpeptidase family protein n=1 Tax=Photobacterium rosenbergii TaxID=294936 RepID=UPI001C99784B|nr:L,D-transpeptidase family protein [Photobacterium rosenbergii]MBY5945965.1 L,D-transpeptidase family protein [Photobacterium rosenbergii]
MPSVNTAFLLGGFLYVNAISAQPVNTDVRLDYSLIDPVGIYSTQQICPDVGSSVCFADLTEKVYVNNGFLPIWDDTALRQGLYTKLSALHLSGLFSGVNLRLSELKKLEARQDIRGFDILATDSYLTLKAIEQSIENKPTILFRHQTVQPLNKGEISIFTSSYSYFELEQTRFLNQVYADLLLPSSTQTAIHLAESFNDLASHSYQPLKRGLIKQGQSIPDGHDLLDVLNTYGDINIDDYLIVREQQTISNSGVVNQAIRRFQLRNGLEDDGILGPSTSRQIALPYQEVSRLIALNLYRSQLGATGDERPSIRVNIPDYRMQITYNQQVVFESKVIVGQTTRPTNLFSSSMNIMVVNPRWNVPETIKKKDVIPGMKASPDYLQQKNLTMIRSWRDRTEISPEMVEWSTVNPHTFPYEFMQRPGSGNALGNVKFLMPNDYSVYLHDTPTRSLFNKAKRNLSSGCVRVEKAAELAEYVLDYQQRPGWRNYQQLVSDRSTDTITLPRKLDVDVTYVTAWVDENNQLQLREDIYGYDRPIKRPVKLKYSTVKNYRQ